MRLQELCRLRRWKCDDDRFEWTDILVSIGLDRPARWTTGHGNDLRPRLDADRGGEVWALGPGRSNAKLGFALAVLDRARQIEVRNDYLAQLSGDSAWRQKWSADKDLIDEVDARVARIRGEVDSLSRAGALPLAADPGLFVRAVIGRRNSAIRRCFRVALRVNPDAAGQVAVDFTVGTAGTVTDARVTAASSEMSSCVRRKYLQVRGLPLLEAPMSFRKTYSFSKW